MPITSLRPLLLAAALLVLGGCAAITPQVDVRQPTTALPPAPAYAPVNDGSIFQADGRFQPLFEDRRARRVGDTLVIDINEKLNASKKVSTSASRTGKVGFGVPAVVGLPGKSFQGANLDASSSNTFEGDGGSDANNVFTGTIAVTVIQVLANGNLVVSGEKQIGINQGTEYVRFSGVVNPATIMAGNVVSSTQVADARLQYKGTGVVDEAQTMGWLARFFLSVLPF